MSSFQIWSLAIKKVYAKRRQLLNATFFPLLIVIGLDVLNAITEYSGNIEESKLWGIKLIIFSVSVMLWAKIAVTTHRIILLGSNSVSVRNNFEWHDREFGYFIQIIFIGFLVVISVLFVTFLFIAIDSILTNNSSSIFKISAQIIATFIGYWVAIRWSVVLPSIAVDRSISLTEAWGKTADHGLLAFGTLIIVPGLSSLVVYFVLYTMSSIGTFMQLPTLLTNFLMFSITFFFIAIILYLCVAALSVLYQYITSNQQENFSPRNV